MSSQGEDPQCGSSHEQTAATAPPDDDAEVDTHAPSPDSAKLTQRPEFAANDRADYQLTSGLFRELVGVRFRLLGFLPTVSGAILAALSALDLAPEVVIGPVLVGLVVTWGLTLYEVRNSQIHDNAVHRSEHLELLLGLSPSIPSSSPGGFFGERTKLQLFLAPLTSSPSSKTSNTKAGGRVPVKHDSALAIVYGVVLASWAAVLAFNVVRFLDEHFDEVDNGSNHLAWRVSIGAGLVVGLVGWRVVSALSRTGRNLRIVYRLAPLARRDDSSWPDSIVAELKTLHDDAAAGKQSEPDEQAEQDERDVWDLAMAVGVVTDRRKTWLRPKLVIESGNVDPANPSCLAQASRSAILGLELADDPTPNLKHDTCELRRRMVCRYGNAPWCSKDEVRYRTELLDHLESSVS